MEITIPCGHCSGRGTVALPDHLANVLDCLKSGAETTPDLVDAMRVHYHEIVTIPAMCNRLKALEQFGLASKSKTVQPSGGCWYIWRPSNSDDPAVRSRNSTGMPG